MTLNHCVVRDIEDVKAFVCMHAAPSMPWRWRPINNINNIMSKILNSNSNKY